jgi:hypothetical protein
MMDREACLRVRLVSWWAVDWERLDVGVVLELSRCKMFEIWPSG